MSRVARVLPQLGLCLLVASLPACFDEIFWSGGPRTVEQCGNSLEELMREGDWLGPPALTASYSEALESWPLDESSCGLAVWSGECADGKRLLYRSGGFTSEVRYFEGEQLVAVVTSGDVGQCPSVCPFSRYHGRLADVRCEEPVFEELCGSSSSVPEATWLPFANGKAPGGCAD